MKQLAVYILTNRPRGVLYIGVTSDLSARIYQHKTKITKGFSKKYNLDKLVWYEIHDIMSSAITREKQLKYWKRNWKIELFEKNNKHWDDLYNLIV